MRFDPTVYEENLRLLLDEFHQQLSDGTKNTSDFISTHMNGVVSLSVAERSKAETKMLYSSDSSSLA